MKIVPKKSAPAPEPKPSPASTLKLKPKVAAAPPPTTSPTAPQSDRTAELEERQARHIADHNAFKDRYKGVPKKDRYTWPDLVPLTLTEAEVKAAVRRCDYCKAEYICPCDGKNPKCMNKQWKDSGK